MSTMIDFIATPFYVCRGINSTNRQKAIDLIRTCNYCGSNETIVDIVMSDAAKNEDKHCTSICFKCLRCGMDLVMHENDLFKIDDFSNTKFSTSTNYSLDHFDKPSSSSLTLTPGKVQIKELESKLSTIIEKTREQTAFDRTKSQRKYAFKRLEQLRAKYQQARQARYTEMGPLVELLKERGIHWDKIMHDCQRPFPPLVLDAEKLTNYYEAVLITQALQSPRSEKEVDPMYIESAALWQFDQMQKTATEFNKNFSKLIQEDIEASHSNPGSHNSRPPTNFNPPPYMMDGGPNKPRPLFQYPHPPRGGFPPHPPPSRGYPPNGHRPSMNLYPQSGPPPGHAYPPYHPGPHFNRGFGGMRGRGRGGRFPQKFGFYG